MAEKMVTYEQAIDWLFYGARNTTFSVPEKYRENIMRGMVHFAMEQLHDGTEENTQIIYKAYERWTGEKYKSDSEGED